jgi:hypothetical protein
MIAFIDFRAIPQTCVKLTLSPPPPNPHKRCNMGYINKQYSSVAMCPDAASHPSSASRNTGGEDSPLEGQTLQQMASCTNLSRKSDNNTCFAHTARLVWPNKT